MCTKVVSNETLGDHVEPASARVLLMLPHMRDTETKPSLEALSESDLAGVVGGYSVDQWGSGYVQEVSPENEAAFEQWACENGFMP